MRRGNVYGGSGLDRAPRLRSDDAWLEARLGDKTSRFAPMWRSRNLVSRGEEPRAVLLPRTRLGDVLNEDATVALLGLAEGAAHFAVDLSHLDRTAAAGLADRAAFADLREVGAILPSADAALLAYARGLLHWHARHRFCGVCGAPTRALDGGHMRLCTRAACAAEHFPRTDPAVIMLVERGDACLLARQASWPAHLYSALAGFVEPGESLEEAVAREVKEETGVIVGAVSYQSSQPWPFPSSLMLGFVAEAEGDALDVNRDELEDAGWYSREDLERAEDKHLRLPRPDSIARRLIDDWLRRA